MRADRVAVAYSGGRDSTALLHATLAASADLGVEVLALHVHHGLNPYAEAWLVHCEGQCSRWARGGKRIQFVAHRLSGRPAKGESVEAWARQSRYRALREMAVANGADTVLLAHHQRDQAETWVLQALRGAGVAGLAGMPRCIERDGITWQRPWLEKARDEIDAYVRRHRLKHIEDDSNAEPRFARNRLRLQVWPALADAFEHVDESFARAATWAQEAHELLEEIAALDLASVDAGRGLHVIAWRALSPARRSNALRAWIRRNHRAPSPTSLIVRLLDELPAQRSARWPLGDAELQLHRGVLRYRAAAIARSSDKEAHLSILRAGAFALPGWGGTLRAQRVREGGIPLAWLAQLDLRPRTGGEQFQSGVGRPPRSLKKQFQGAGLSAWDRNGPLVYSGGQLVFVPGLGLDARVIGLPGQTLVALHWLTPAQASDPGAPRRGS